jgi:hypothetical protein
LLTERASGNGDKRVLFREPYDDDTADREIGGVAVPTEIDEGVVLIW